MCESKSSLKKVQQQLYGKGHLKIKDEMFLSLNVSNSQFFWSDFIIYWKVFCLLQIQTKIFEIFKDKKLSTILNIFFYNPKYDYWSKHAPPEIILPYCGMVVQGFCLKHVTRSAISETILRSICTAFSILRLLEKYATKKISYILKFYNYF